ncbi:MAG: Acetolactate synthase/2/3 large subunit [Naasia sp.]|nr:Acetolactate synthase/2/3 large subunit [Naasia sp.]
MTTEQAHRAVASRPLAGAELLLRSLSDRGVDTIYINPGTDTAPLHRAVEIALREGRPAPRLVLCPHETVALAAAHAHFAVTGQVSAVFVHVDVGTQNLGSMVHNAARAGAGVLIMAGVTPYDEFGAVHGGRDHIVHWLQDAPDQAGIVRQYVKAAFNPAHASVVHATVQRAIDLAGTAPTGPVYLTFGREMLIETAPEPAELRRARIHRSGPSPAAVDESLREIRASSRPVLVTSRVGQDPEAVAPFTRLAELLGAQVVDPLKERMNFPPTHPLAATDPRAALAEADLVIVVDAPVPWILGTEGPGPGCRILVVDTDPLQGSMPNWAFPADVRVTSSPRNWLEAIIARLEAEGAAPVPLGQPHAASERPKPGSSLTASDVLAVLADHLTPEDRLLEESTTSAGAVRQWLPRTLPGTLFRAGGAGLGWALGALLGAKVADRKRPTFVVVGDGSFIFSAPVAALTALRRERADGLIVVLQNGGYAASSQPVHALFPEDRRPQPPATAFIAEVDIAGIAAACGATGFTVSSAENLLDGVEQAVAEWRRGGLAVLAAKVTSPWITEADY